MTIIALLCFQTSAAAWRQVFFISAEIYVFGAAIYLLLGTGVEQPWAKARRSRPISNVTSAVDSFDDDDDDQILTYRSRTDLQS